MHCIYIWQLVWPIAAPLAVRMRSYKRGVAIVGVYPYPVQWQWGMKNHLSINWGQFQDLVCYLWFVHYVVTSWSLTQEVVGLSIFLNKIQWKYLRTTQMLSHSCAAFVLSCSHIAFTLRVVEKAKLFFCNILNNLLAILIYSAQRGPLRWILVMISCYYHALALILISHTSALVVIL